MALVVFDDDDTDNGVFNADASVAMSPEASTTGTAVELLFLSETATGISLRFVL